MGIPSYFRNITKNYSNIIINDLKNVKSLYLDLNCAIHRCCRDILDNLDTKLSQNELEIKMIHRIIDYIVELYLYVKPTELLYIGIDGVAPRAKMVQQRTRRFKTAKDRDITNKIKAKYNIKTPMVWDTNAITPGTAFMEKLSNLITNDLIKREELNGITIILSDSNCPGEGEHKIFKHIKNDIIINGPNIEKTQYGIITTKINNEHLDLEDNTQDLQDNIKDLEDNKPKLDVDKVSFLEQPNVNELDNTNSDENYIKGNYVIYGLDADLIMLSLTCNIDNIYLIREELEFNPEEKNIVPYLFLDINHLSEGIIEEMRSNGLQYNGDIYKWKHINDYIVLCFLLGNDFIPHILSLEIKHNGLDVLTTKYIEIFNSGGQYLMDQENGLNYEFFHMLLGVLTHEEDIRLRRLTKKTLNYYWMPNNTHNKMEEELDKLHNYPLFNRTLEKEFSLGVNQGWREDYYKYVVQLDEHDIPNLCLNYYQGLVWTLAYYFKNCISRNWHYKYGHSPSIRELYNNIELLKEVKFTDNIEIKPFEQLLMVLPTNSNHLLPINYQRLQTDAKSPVLDYYPIDFEVNSYYKRYNWECGPILPTIDIKKLKTTIKNIKLSPDEKNRNSENQEQVINL